MECVALPKQSIKQFKPVQQSREQPLRAYCPNIYTVNTGREQEYIKYWPDSNSDSNNEISEGRSKDQQTPAKEDFESVWQMLAIVLSIAIMIVVFAIILVQGTVFNKKVLGQESQLVEILLNH